MYEPITCIYMIENKINNKIYIGQTNDYNRRINEHKRRYNDNTAKHERIYLYRVIKKYGLENFEFSILKKCKVTELNRLEKYYIKKYKSFKNGYNMTEGGQNDHPNRKLNKEDVVFLRKLYDSQTEMSNEEIWNKYFKNIITLSYFRNLWRGVNWKNVMPEVFTEDNKKYYLSKNTGATNKKSTFTDNEILEMRKRYVLESAKSIHNDYKDKISLRGMEAILRGQIYKHIPIYKKHKKKWINKNYKREKK